MNTVRITQVLTKPKCFCALNNSRNNCKCPFLLVNNSSLKICFKLTTQVTFY